jgi:dihydroorotate dehydrogenase
VYLKIAPDLSETQIVEIGEIVTLTGANGVIATNTTIDRSNLLSRRELVEKIGAGGLSGRPLNSKSTEVIRLLRRTLGPSKTIIGIGGIETAQDAMNKIEAGANLVQVYTGYIYRGPGLVKEIVNTQRN